MVNFNVEENSAVLKENASLKSRLIQVEEEAKLQSDASSDSTALRIQLKMEKEQQEEKRRRIEEVSFIPSPLALVEDENTRAESREMASSAAILTLFSIYHVQLVRSCFIKSAPQFALRSWRATS